MNRDHLGPVNPTHLKRQTTEFSQFASKVNKGYIASGKNAKVVVFDLKTLEGLKEIPAGKKPDIIIYDNLSSQLFVFNADDNSVTVINPGTSPI